MSTNQTPPTHYGLTDEQAALLKSLRAEGLTNRQIIDRIVLTNRAQGLDREKPDPLVLYLTEIEFGRTGRADQAPAGGGIEDESAPVAQHLSDAQAPAPAVRILTEEEYDAAYDALRGAAYRHGSRLASRAVHEALTESLAVLGVFTPPIDADPEYCTALYLPTDPEAFGADMLGHWQQCADEPGHDGDDHDSGNTSWSDGDPNTIPSTAAQD